MSFDMQVSVYRTELIETLRKNAEQHKQDFETAWSAYREQIVKDGRRVSHAAKYADFGSKLETMPHRPIPQEYLDDYEMAVNMLEASEDSLVTLSFDDFKRFVKNEWDWSYNFNTSNTYYTSSV